MILCFTGTHGSGKTTLAQEIAKRSQCAFYPSLASKAHEMAGVKASDDIPFAKRLDVQETILKLWSLQYADAVSRGQVAVFDRCPLDFAAYTLADVTRGLPHDLAVRAENYIKRCVGVVNELDHVLLVLPHGANLGNRGDGKPDAANKAYEGHIHYLLFGMLMDSDAPFEVIEPGSIEERVDQVCEYMNDVWNESADETERVRRRL
ncbi:MAG: ATP-binding protein [Alphaproteobacteria bacterium]|nr:ATP-binding protein [Alphaproteobacteria bacterium]